VGIRLQIRFVGRTNFDIDRLVQICWQEQGLHQGEYFQIPNRADLDPNDLINDEREEEVEAEESPQNGTHPINLSDLSAAERSEEEDTQANKPFVKRLVIAVDSGVVDLGEFVGGAIAFAVRGAAVCLINNGITVLRYSTGPILIDEHNQVSVFGYMGGRLGKEDLYLARTSDGKLVPRPSAFDTGNQLRDRCRNFVERIVQEEALSVLASNGGGLLLLDGALPAGTFDTPQEYLRSMLRAAARNKIDIAAVSKKSRVAVGGRPVSALFDDLPTFVGYAQLKEALTRERDSYVEQGIVREASQITLANELFAARFGLGPPALTFRVDVQNSIRSTPSEVLRSVFDRCQIQGCYPRPLIDAHQHSSFLPQEVQSFTADLVARTGARPKEDPSMEWIFAPFGAFGK
jgi:hypothetical protein